MSLGIHTLRMRYHQTPLIHERRSIATRERHIFFTTLILLTAIFIGIMYVIQINSLATKGHQMRVLEKRILQQKETNRKLETQLIEAQALGLVQKRIEMLGLVQSDRIEFLGEKHPVAVLR